MWALITGASRGFGVDSRPGRAERKPRAGYLLPAHELDREIKKGHQKKEGPKIPQQTEFFLIRRCAAAEEH